MLFLVREMYDPAVHLTSQEYKEIQHLKCRNIKLEAYTRRESIKIYNIQEIEGETPRDTEDLVHSMMEEKMKI